MSIGSMSELLDELGVPPERIHMTPLPGTATEEDVIALCDRNIYCELIDGVLVEKAVGQYESRLATWLSYFLLDYIEDGHDLGVVHGADSPHRFFAGQIRYPDVAFVSYDRLPGGKPTEEPIAPWVPNLAVEIISTSNTPREMELKLGVYFSSGVQCVWYAYPKTRTVDVYTAVDEKTTLTEDDSLDGGEILPGFKLSIARWFNKAQ